MDKYKVLRGLLQQFADKVVERAQQNLGASRSYTINGRRINNRAVVSGNLKNSLRGVVKDDLTLSFFATGSAQKYAAVIEHGQFGKGGKAPTNDEALMPTRGAGELPNAKMPPSSAILEWMNNKPLRFRDLNGRFVQKPSEAKLKSIAFAIAKSIEDRGRVGVHYFRDAYLELLPIYNPQIMEAIGEDIRIELLNQLRIIKAK
jgi:hypothetical protein